MATFFYSSLIIFFFYAALVHLITGLLFLRIRTSPAGLIVLLCINSALLLVLLAPYFFQYYGIYSFSSKPLLTSISELIFPCLYALLAGRYAFNNSLPSRHIIPVFILAGFGIIMIIITPGYCIEIKGIIFIISYLYILHMLSRAPSRFFVRILMLLTISLSLYIAIGFFFDAEIHYLIAPAVASLFLFYLLASDYISRIDILIDQVTSTTAVNHRLNHQIHRLKGSIEQCRRIINEKDLELYQVSRHASLAEITTGIGHELTQPLTGIKGIAQNMIDDLNYDEFDAMQAVSELMKICSLVDKSSSIINHIRNFSRKGTVSKKMVDLNTITLNAIELINLQLKKNDIDIIFVLDETIPQIYGDSISLEQLIINIILNSRDAIIEKQHSVKDYRGQIRISTIHTETTVRVTIEDNGPGIPEEIKTKIWSPFFTSKKKSSGTGIGLSICNKILKDHDAEVILQSDKDGTAFIFDFPIQGEKKSQQS